MTILLSILVMAFACLYNPVSSAGPLNGYLGKVSGNDTSSKPGATKPGSTVTAAALASVTDTELVTTTYTYPGTVHRQEMELYTLTVPKSYTLGEVRKVESGATMVLKPFMPVYESIVSDFIGNIGSDHEHALGMAVTCPADAPPTVTGGEDDHGRRYFNLYRSVSKSTPSLYWLVFTGDVHDASLNKATLKCGSSSISVLAIAQNLEAAALVSVTDTELVTTTYTYPGTVHRQEIERYSLTVPTSYTLGEFSQYDDGTSLVLEPFIPVYESIISDFIGKIGTEHYDALGMAVICHADDAPTVTGGQDDHSRRYFNLYRSVSKSTPSLYWLVFTGDVNDASYSDATLHCGGHSTPLRLVR